jgi:hypothetical protein
MNVTAAEIKCNYTSYDYKSNLDFMKVKVMLSQRFNRAPRHKDILGSGGIAPCILDLGIRWKWVQFHAPAALPPGKEPLAPIA